MAKNRKNKNQNAALEAALNGKKETEETVEKTEETVEKKTVKPGQKYEVIVASLGGKNNKIFNHKEMVTADQLNSSVEELIAAGFIK